MSLEIDTAYSLVYHNHLYYAWNFCTNKVPVMRYLFSEQTHFVCHSVPQGYQSLEGTADSKCWILLIWQEFGCQEKGKNLASPTYDF